MTETNLQKIARLSGNKPVFHEGDRVKLVMDDMTIPGVSTGSLGVVTDINYLLTGEISYSVE